MAAAPRPTPKSAPRPVSTVVAVGAMICRRGRNRDKQCVDRASFQPYYIERNG